MYLVVKRKAVAEASHRQRGPEPKTKYWLYFQFDSPLQSKGKSATLYFKNARIRYRPDHLYGQD